MKFLPVGPCSNKKKNFSFGAGRDHSEKSKLIKIFLTRAEKGISAWNEGGWKLLEKKGEVKMISAATGADKLFSVIAQQPSQMDALARMALSSGLDFYRMETMTGLS